jgi:enterochelin esterase-like enzyme
MPKLKDSMAIYFLAGSFNSWKVNDPAYKFSKIANGNYTIDKQLPNGYYEYKVTRGSWSNAEAGIQGNPASNRTLKLQHDTSINLIVLNWTDEFKTQHPNHTASANVKLVDSVFSIPQLNTKRKVWIYLPQSYGKSNKKYPVIYMHDGQNLFDEFTGGYGEWGVDELLDKMIAQGKKEYIVVGTAHGGAERLKEYNPYDSKYGKGRGKAYVSFLVNNLKPFIDKEYRTLKDKNNTSIAGSPMGGLISLYAISTYPNIFGTLEFFRQHFGLLSQ